MTTTARSGTRPRGTTGITRGPLHHYAFTIVSCSGLAGETCLRHLGLLGAHRAGPSTPPYTADHDSNIVAEITIKRRSSRGARRRDTVAEPLRCVLRWEPPGQDGGLAVRSEAMVQAVSGLMAIHGREQSRPRRVGLEICSVAAGIVATQGILAGLIAQERGLSTGSVEVSVLEAALLFASHHIAIATSGDDFLQRSAADALLRFPDASPGPPFRTADGQTVEIEALSDASWIEFWTRVGAPRNDAAEAWNAYVFRYLSAWSLMPATLHRAAAMRSGADLADAAAVSGVEIRRVRDYGDVVTDLARARASTPVSDRWPATEMTPAPWTFRFPSRSRSPEAREQTGPTAPLAGLRVVDLTTRLQGPLAAHLLSCLGAEVTRIEPPGGDIGRVGPIKSLHGAYLAYNRGKHVTELDYHTPAGRHRLENLAADTDVYIHNWRPGRAEQIGLGFEHLIALNPQILYAHASGWDVPDISLDTGGAVSAIAGDFLVQAQTGCSDGLTPTGESPRPSRLAFVDITGGLIACEAVLAGLLQRARTGNGGRVDTALLSGAYSLQDHVLGPLITGEECTREWGRPSWGMLDAPVESRDRFLLIDARDALTRARLAAASGAQSVEGVSVSDSAIRGRLRERPASEWLPVLRDAGVSAAIVDPDLSAVTRDPRVAALLEATGNGCRAPAAPWRFNGVKPGRRRDDRLPAPARIAQTVGRLAGAAEALGVLTAVLSLRSSDRRAHRALEHKVGQVLTALGVGDILDELAPEALTALAGLAQARLRQAVDFALDPTAAPGWNATDADMLQAQGRGSAAFVPILQHAVAPRLEGLTNRLTSRDATCLDVGTGVAALAIELARAWPQLEVVGLDTWEPALAIARANVEAASLGGRVRLRREDVSRLAGLAAYDLTWFPVSFIAPTLLSESLRRVRRATRPGGWIIANMYSGMDDLTLALAQLRTTRSGGTVLSTTEAEDMLTDAGFVQVRTLPREILPPVALVVGRRE